MKQIEADYMTLSNGNTILILDQRYIRWIEELNFFQLLLYKLPNNSIVRKLIENKEKFYIQNKKTHNIVEAHYAPEQTEGHWILKYRVLKGTEMVVLDDWDMEVVYENKDRVTIR